ncbi:MAG: CoA transferase [Dehalococcoidia bacterium]|nr:CoA transferase [Dehalococcoidia bacterium]
MASPLEGLSVLDISEGIAGPFCAKLLADLGARVCKVEAPAGGDRTRRLGPFPGGDPEPEASGSFIYLNTSKLGITLDISSSEGREQFARLLGEYDVVVAGESEGELAERGLGYDQLREWNPSVILTTISGFGSSGPYAGYRWSHLTACASGGWSDTCGVADREPLQAGGSISQTLAGSFGATATALAVLGRHAHGGGDHVDVSAQESTLVAALIPTLFYEYSGQVRQRNSTVASGPSFILPSADGHVGVNVLTEQQWELLVQYLGLGEMLEDPRFQPGERQLHANEVRELFMPLVAERTSEEIFSDGQTWRVPFGLVPDAAGVRGFLPHEERGFFETLDQPIAGEVDVPGIWFKSTATSPTVGPAPQLGEHNADVFGGLSAARDVNGGQPAVAGAARATAQAAALDGVRIIDLSMFMSGPMATQICADAGADVIKVESLQRLDGWRGAARGATDDPDAAPQWERSPFFNWVNRNKRDITLNLTDPQGAELLKQLVAGADVVIENYTPRVMANFGLTYEVLKAVKPDLIMLSMPGFGSDVSWRDYVAFGMSTEQMAGMSHLTGYEDGPPIFTGTNGGDPFVGVMAALTLAAALHHRDRTGEGQHIDLSQIEASTMFIGQELAGWSLSGHDPQRVGNRHATMTPHDNYPCEGGRWVAIACRSDGEWRALATLIGRPEWASEDSPFATAAGRRAERGTIDAALAEWTRPQRHTELMHALQGVGVTAAAVLNGPELLDDPHLKARRFFKPQDRPGVGLKHYPGQPHRFVRAAAVDDSRAPLLGEHSREVLGELLGLGDAELDALEQADVTGTMPMAARGG